MLNCVEQETAFGGEGNDFIDQIEKSAQHEQVNHVSKGKRLEFHTKFTEANFVNDGLDRIPKDNNVQLTDFLTSNERLRIIQDSIGDFGVALFCPLLDLEHTAPSRSQSIRTSQTYSIHSDSLSLYEPSSDSICISSDRLPQHATITLQSPVPSCTRTNCSGATDDDETVDDSDNDEYNNSINSSNEYLRVSIHLEPDIDLEECPRILTEQMMQELRDYGMPKMLQQYQFRRCFCIGLHGDSFVTLLSQCRPFKYTILVLRTTRGDILGGFASETWQPQVGLGTSRGSYYGNGLSFLFVNKPTLKQNDSRDDVNAESSSDSRQDSPTGTSEQQLSIFHWTGKNDYCQICDVKRRMICMGGVGDFGLIVQNSLATGRTGWSETYGNPPLLNEYGGAFEIADFEIYGLSPLSQQSAYFDSTPLSPLLSRSGSLSKSPTKFSY